MLTSFVYVEGDAFIIYIGIYKVYGKSMKGLCKVYVRAM